jgi:hypothetical protein
MIDYTLAVTSPLTTSDEVGRAQHILNKHNVHKKDWHRGPVDHVFGAVTAQSCIRAKYWLGYPEADLRGTYGPTLDAYLLGEAELTAQMRARIKERMKPKPLRAKMLAEAKKHLGVKENPPGSNRVRFSDWYGIRGPWCAMFVSYCGVKARSRAFAKGVNPPSSLHPGSGTYAYVPFVVSDARFGRNGLQTVRDPVPGDLVCFDWDGGVADHIGFFVKWTDRERGFFRSLEGNTAIGNDSNGGEVMYRDRQFAQVECFVRVGR